MINKQSACLLVSALLVSPANANSFFEKYMIDPDDGMLDASRYLSEVPLGFLPVPTIITEPAVGNGLALMGIFFHEDQEQRQSRQHNKKPVLPSNISIAGFGATSNGSKGLGAGHLGFWFKDTLRYKGYILYPDFNLDFYSLGGKALSRSIELNITGPAVVQSLSARLGDSKWFAGVHQVYRNVETTLANSHDFTILPDGAIPDEVTDYLAGQLNNQVQTSGLGLIVQYDSRNNPMNPELGYNYDFEITRFDDAIGSDVNYWSYHAEGLNYWHLSDKIYFALRLQYDAIDVDDGEKVPAYVPPSVDLRGVSATRYQGNSVVTSEIEVTYKMNYRWKFNAFTGLGKAANSFGDLNSAESVHNYGVGFRYLIAKRYGFNMGIDLAKGPEDNTIYIQSGSTW